jgi:hypothetical protein
MKYHKFVYIAKTYTNYKLTIKTVNNNIIRLSILEDQQFGKIEIKNKSIYTSNYYNGNLNKLTINCEYFNINFKIYVQEEPIAIRQIYMNNTLKITFMDDIKKMYGLREYDNDDEPAIFYGLMTNDDISVLEKNKSLKVIVWVGGDINDTINRNAQVARMIKTNLDRILKVTKIRHVSISSFISNSLTNMKLPYKMVPFMGIDFSKYKPILKGPCIYLYTAIGFEEYYGLTMYTKLMEKYSNIKFIVTCCLVSYQYLLKNPELQKKYEINYYTKEELINEIYPKCFIGLRLTDHDGLSATVQELGLMGIKSVHNGASPSALKYETFEDICRHIDEEIKTIGEIDNILASNVEQYLTIDPNFLNSKYYSDL